MSATPIPYTVFYLSRLPGYGGRAESAREALDGGARGSPCKFGNRLGDGTLGSAVDDDLGAGAGQAVSDGKTNARRRA